METLDVAYLFSQPLVFGEEALPFINIELDRQNVVSAMEESGKNITFRSEVATPDNLRSIITKGVKIIHFSGHGLDKSLALENGVGGTHQILHAEKLKNLFEAGNTNGVDFVFVAACNSELVGSAFCEANVPHVVAIRFSSDDIKYGLVTDKASRTFAHSFYLALFCGRTVRQAFDIGRARVFSDSSLMCSNDSNKFLLLPHYETSLHYTDPHDKILFNSLPIGRLVNKTPIFRSNIPSVPENFFGIMYQFIFEDFFREEFRNL